MREHMERQIKERLRKKMVALPEFSVQFLRLLENSKQPGTLHEYAKDIYLFLDFLVKSEKCDKRQVKDIEPGDLDVLNEDDILDFFDYVSVHTRTFKTVKDNVVDQEFTNAETGKSRKLATLRKLFEYLFKRKLINRNVLPNIEIKVPKKAKIKVRLTPEEIQRFFITITDDVNVETRKQKLVHDRVKFRDYIMCLLLAYTGIRISELVQLDLNDIMLTKQKLVVVRKGGNEQAITMPERVLEDIASYLIYRKAIPNIAKQHQQAAFISLHHRRIDPRSVRALLKKYEQRSGIDVHITPHVFRRTFGTNHYNTYEDMYLTAEILGHSSAETTRRFYADPEEDRVARSMHKFDYGISHKSDNKSDDPEASSDEKLIQWAEQLGISVEELIDSISNVL